MKKIIIPIALFASVVLFAAVANADLMFKTDLQVGSAGPEVTALQNWLIQNLYRIPSIESGKATAGRFGSETKVAVMKFQKDHKLPSTGFVGPLTRGILNATSVGSSTVSTIMTPLATSVSCPVGFTCSPIVVSTTTPVLAPLQTTITTPGIAGSLDVTLQSTPSGVSLDKGQEGDIASFKVAAGASDMAINSISLAFNSRIWMYAGSISIKDENGTTIAQMDNLSSQNFSELTIGTRYSLRLGNLNYIVPKGSTKYLTVHLKMLVVSDRLAASGTTNGLALTGFDVRSVDGAGIAVTSTSATGSSDTGLACASASLCRVFSYLGGNTGQLVATISPLSPPIGFLEISSSIPTKDSLLGVYTLKSQGKAGMMSNLVVGVGAIGNGNSNALIQSLFTSINLKVGDQIVATGAMSNITGSSAGYENATVTFSNLNVPLPADQNIDISILGTLAPDTGRQFEGMYATTTLDLTNASNITVQDASFNTIVPNSISFSSNIQQVTESIIGLGGLPTTTYGTLSTSGDLTSANQTFTFTIPLMGGKNPIYIPKNIYAAIGTTTSPAGLTIVGVDLSDSDSNGDSSTYFYLAPGQIKTFTAIYRVSGNSSSSGTFKLSQLNYGTTAGVYDGAVISPDITNILTAVLFH